MNEKINLLLEQKHLLSEIDLYIYSTFLGENEINELMDLFNLKEASLEDFVNTLPKIGRISHQETFVQYLKFREKIREKEKDFFKKILDKISNKKSTSPIALT